MPESMGSSDLPSMGTEPGARFKLVRWREGYDVAEVDAFVAKVEAGGVASSADVESVRFTPVRLRQGYEMGAVDAYLDGIAARLRASGR